MAVDIHSTLHLTPHTSHTLQRLCALTNEQPVRKWQQSNPWVGEVCHKGGVRAATTTQVLNVCVHTPVWATGTKHMGKPDNLTYVQWVWHKPEGGAYCSYKPSASPPGEVALPSSEYHPCGPSPQ